MTAAPRIFISYSRSDEAFAESLESRLRALDRFDVRRDRRALEAGEDWWRQLQEEIAAADTFLLCISEASLKSDNVRREWEYAKSVGTRILPIAAASITYTKLPRWLSRVHIPDLREEAAGYAESWQGLLDTLGKPYEPRRAVFMGDAPPPHFVERPTEFDAIKRGLIDEKVPMFGITGVVGGGGFGKTTLAQALAHDRDIRDWFYDGVLWLTLGESATEQTLLSGARDFILKLTNQPCLEQSTDGVKSAFKQAIGDRYILIILDDVWSTLYRQVFDSLGVNAAVLVTTRQRGLLPTNASTQEVNELSEEQAQVLFSAGIDAMLEELGQPVLSQAQLEKLKELVHRFKGYAQLIELSNAALRAQLRRRRTFDEVVGILEEDYRDLGVLAWDARNPTERREALSLSISASLKPESGLSAVDIRRVEELAIFKDDSDVPLTTLQLWWHEKSERSAERFAEQLHDLSLIKYDAKRQVLRIHDVIREALAARLNDLPALHSRLVDAWRDPYALPDGYAWRNYDYHLIKAERADRLHKLLLDYRWLQAKLDATDVSALVADCDQLAGDEVIRLLKSALTMSAHVLNEHKDQLASHLHGRFYRHAAHAEIIALRAACEIAAPLLPLDNDFDALLPAGGNLLATFSGHTRDVFGAVVLNDRTILSWSGDGTLRRWARDGIPLVIYSGHTDRVQGVLTLDDGTLLSWSSDGTLRRWALDGTPLATFSGNTSSVRGALALSDGTILSWGEKWLWRWTRDGTLLVVYSGHTRQVMGALTLADNTIVTWSLDGTLRRWALDGTLLVVYSEHTREVMGALTLDDDTILSWSNDMTLRRWTRDGMPLATFSGHTSWVKGVLVLDDKTILSWSDKIGIDDYSLRRWARDGTPLTTFSGHTREVNGALALDNDTIISWSWDMTLRRWARDGTELATFSGHTGEVKGALTLDDGTILSWSGNGSSDGTLRRWALDGTPLATFRGHIYDVRGALALDDEAILSWSSDGTLRCWVLDDSSLIISTGHTDRVHGVLALDDDTLLSWSSDGTLRSWVRYGTPLATFSGHTSDVIGALVLDDETILSWSYDATLQRWALDGTQLATFSAHTKIVYGALALNDGTILSRSYDGTMRRWVQDGMPLATFSGHTSSVNGTLALDDDTVISWSRDNTLRCWTHDGTVLATLSGHTREVNGALALDDTTILSWSDDKTLRRWARDGTALGIFSGHTREVNGALALDDSHSGTSGTIVSWSYDGTLRRWMLDGTQIAILDEPYWGDKPRIFAWARDHGFDGNLLYFEKDEPRIAGLRAARRGNAVILYDPASGSARARWDGDARITCLAALPGVLAAGDEVGRVVFLRYAERSGVSAMEI
jgi:hypothetical protein